MSQLRIKHTYDALFYTVPFLPLLNPGESVSGTPTFSITPVTSPALVASNPSVLSDGTTVKFKLAGGIDGTTYTIAVKASITGDGTQNAEATVYMQINDAS